MSKGNSRENIEIAMNHQESSMLPVMPLVGLASTSISSIPLGAILNDGDKQAKSQLLALGYFNYDGVLTCMDLTVEVETLGAPIIYPENDFPYVAGYPIKHPESLLDLKPPLVTESRLSVFVQSTKALAKEVGESHFVGSYAIGPFTLAGHLLGAENLLEMTIEQPEELIEMIAHCRMLVEPYIHDLIDAGSHNIVILEPTASSTILSPRFFSKFSQPELKKMVKFVHARDCKATIHICGNTAPIIEKMCNMGADALSIDSVVDLSEAKNIAKKRVTLIGNIDTSLMRTGTKEQVEKACRDCLSKAAKGGGYILSSGCDIPLGTPRSNIQTLVDLGHEFKAKVTS